MNEIDLDRWDAWSPAQAAGWLNRTGVVWAVAGGWALELFMGESWRGHEDLEIVIDQEAFDTIRDLLPPLEWFIAADGKLYPLELADDDDEDEDELQRSWQTWGRDPESGYWRIDVMRESWQSGEWCYRRDHTIRRPLTDAFGTTQDGVPYLCPEAVLLFKAKHQRPKDEQDFGRVLPRLSVDQSAWLAEALEQTHAGHPWLRSLRTDRQR